MKTRISLFALFAVVVSLTMSAVEQEKRLSDVVPELAAVEYIYGPMDWVREVEGPTPAEARGVRSVSCPNDGKAHFLVGQYGVGVSCSDVTYEKFTSGGGTNVTTVMVNGNARVALTTLADGTAMISWSTSNGSGTSTLQAQSSDSWLWADTSSGFNVIQAMTPEWKEFLGVRSYGKLAAEPVACSSSTLSYNYFNTTINRLCTCGGTTPEYQTPAEVACP